MNTQEVLIELIGQCISFESVEGNNQQKNACIDWIVETFLSDDSSDLIRGEFQDCPYLYYPSTKNELLLFAHVDVVPGTSKQFSIQKDGDILYGRGVKDMKGATIPLLLAFQQYCKQRDTVPPVSILITTDEEIAGKTIPFLLDEGIVDAPVAFTPDTGSSTGIVTEHKGVVWAELLVEGTSGHSAMPWKCINPAWKFADALHAIHNEFPEGSEQDWSITVTPTVLSGSSARNRISDCVRCSLDIRYPAELCTSPEEAISVIESILPSGCFIEKKLSADPLYTDPSHSMVEKIQSIAEQVTQEAVPIIREHGATDARYFSSRGIPAFLYGPKGGDLHGEQEWVSISSLVEQYRFYEILLGSLS